MGLVQQSQVVHVSLQLYNMRQSPSACLLKERKEKFTLLSDHNGSLLRRQPGALPADIRTLCIIHRIVCVIYLVSYTSLLFCTLSLALHLLNCHQTTMMLLSVLHTPCLLHCCTNQALILFVFLVIFCCPQGVAMTLWNRPGATMTVPFSTAA